MTATVSIRRSLLTNLIPVVLLLGIGIFLMMALRTRSAVQELSAALIKQASHRTEVKLQSFFRPVNRQVEAMRLWGESGVLELDRVRALEQLIQPLMIEFPWSSAAFVADERGREFLLSHHDSAWTSRQIRKEEWADRFISETWSDEAPDRVASEGQIDYDPRTRPWYLGAAELLVEEEANGSRAPVFWTEPYRFYSSGRPGITAATAYRDRDGSIHVIGIDIGLTEISRFTSQIHLLDDSTVFVLTADGRMVGVPRTGQTALSEAQIDELLLKRPEELGTTAAQDATDRLIDDPGSWDRPVRLVSDGDAWWGQIRPFELTDEHKLLIGVAVGEGAILGQIRQQRLWVLGITFVVLLLAVWRAVQLAHAYSQPVEQLVQQSERMSTGDLEPGLPIRTRISEVHRLAEAHEHMRQGLETLLKLERDLQVARQIQQSTLPDRLPALPGFDLGCWNQPADETGGDSYDVIGLRRSDQGGFELTGQEAGLALLMLADATGHGIGPALSVTQLRAMLRMAIRLSSDLPEVVRQINQQLHADLPSGRFITAWFGLLDASDGSLTAFSAGQAPLLHYKATVDEFDILESDAIPLGLFPQLAVQPPSPVSLEPGDLFVVLSDGFFEAKDPAGEEQGTDRICQLLRRCRREPAVTIVASLRRATDEFTQGAPPDDDRTILVIRRT